MVETQVDWKLLFMKTGLTAKGCNINGILNGEKRFAREITPLKVLQDST